MMTSIEASRTVVDARFELLSLGNPFFAVEERRCMRFWFGIEVS
jgi:hypothetical protein